MTDPVLVDGTRPAARQPTRRNDVLWACAAALVSLAVAALRLGAPGSLNGLWQRWDLTTTYAITKALAEQPWISPNPDLAYPFVQNLAGFPATDVLNVLALKVLVLLTQDPLVAVNLFLLACFPLIAVTTYAFLRVLRVNPPLAAALAVTASLLPWHFDRLVHAGIANYSSVAVGLILIVAILDWNLRLGGPDGARPATLVLVLGLALYVGLTGTYYAAFITLLALVALVFQVALGRRDRALIAAFWLAVLPFLITAAVTVAYRVGAPDGAGESLARAPEESQVYGGSMFTLLRTTGLWSEAWPVRDLHNVPTLVGTFEADARNSTIGMVAVVLAFVCAGLVLAANGRGRVPRFVTALGYWPWLFLVSVLFFTMGAFGQVFSVFFLYQIRSWGRFSIIVVIIALAILGLVLTHLCARARRGATITAVSALVIVAVTLVDTSTLDEPVDLSRAQREGQELRDYGQALDGSVPDGCPILTMPAYLFPEGVPEDGTATYDPLLPYLFADSPRWSYGGVRGTEAGQWQFDSLSRHVPTVVQQAVAAGFCAIQVDTWAYRGDDSPVTGLQEALGAPVATSSSGRWVTYALDAAGAGPFTRDYILDPVTARLAAGFSDRRIVGSAESGTLEVGTGYVTVVNPRAESVSGTLQLEVRPLLCPIPGTVTLAVGTTPITVDLTGDTTVAVPVDLLPGASIAARVTAPDGCQVEVRNPRFVPTG